MVGYINNTPSKLECMLTPWL